MKKTLIDQTLRHLLPLDGGTLFEAAHYSLEGGKRLRPLITLAVVEAFGEEIEKALHPACAIEMIHIYSLIHDDLPCMDDDDFRRGKPSLHRAYPESHAVLTGDFLLTYAFEVLSQAPLLSAEQRNSLIAALALRAGSQGMIGGQVLDMEGNSERLIEMHTKKTGALITAAFEFGGIIAGQTDLRTLQQIGQHLGLAYQIVDDILDGDGAAELLGLEEADNYVKRLFDKVIELIDMLDAPQLKSIAHEMVFRTI